MRQIVLCALLLAALPAGAQFQSRVTLRGRPHNVTVPQSWSVQLGRDSVTYVPPRGRVAGVNLYAVARSGQNDPFDVAEHYARDFRTKLPHLSVSDTRAIRFVGQNGAIKVLSGTNKVPYEMWIAVALGPDTIYVFTAYATLTELAIVEKDLRAILDGVTVLNEKPAPAAPREAEKKPAEDPFATYDKLPPLPQPSSARPLVDDPLLGLTVDAVPDWGVSVGHDAYTVDKRIGQGKRLLVAFMLGDQAFTGDGDAFARQVAPDGRYAWERYGGRTALSREGQNARELYLLRRGLPLKIVFIVRGAAWNDPAAEAARKQLEKVMRVVDPVRPDPSAGKLRVTIGGVVAVDLPRGWTFRTYGRGANALFDGPGGAQARIMVQTKLPQGNLNPGAPLYEWPQPTCDVDGTRPTLAPAKVAGRDARVGECPRDLEQVGYYIDAGTHWIVLAMGSPAGPKAAPLAAFPKALRLL